MTHLPTSPCRFCQKPIVWSEGTLASGAPGRLPLDPRPPVYVTDLRGDVVVAVRDVNAMVLHQATCGKFQEQRKRSDEDVDALRAEVQKLRDRVVVLTNLLEDARKR